MPLRLYSRRQERVRVCCSLPFCTFETLACMDLDSGVYYSGTRSRLGIVRMQIYTLALSPSFAFSSRIICCIASYIVPLVPSSPRDCINAYCWNMYRSSSSSSVNLKYAQVYKSPVAMRPYPWRHLGTYLPYRAACLCGTKGARTTLVAGSLILDAAEG